MSRQSAWTVSVYACCPGLIINGASPFTVKSVLVWMINYTLSLVIRPLRKKNSSLAVFNRSRSSDVNRLLRFLGDGDQEERLEEVGPQLGLKGEMEEAWGGDADN